MLKRLEAKFNESDELFRKCFCENRTSQNKTLQNTTHIDKYYKTLKDNNDFPFLIISELETHCESIGGYVLTILTKKGFLFNMRTGYFTKNGVEIPWRISHSFHISEFPNLPREYMPFDEIYSIEKYHGLEVPNIIVCSLFGIKLSHIELENTYNYIDKVKYSIGDIDNFEIKGFDIKALVPYITFMVNLMEEYKD